MDRKRFQTLVAVSLIVLVAAACFALRPAPAITVDFLDVGQGDAILVRSGRQQMLVDGGPDRQVLSELGRAMPFFDRTIELVVLTHPHADHYRGLAAVFERYRVEKILVSDDRGPEEYADFLRGVGREAPVIQTRAGDRLIIGQAVAEVLWPERAAAHAADPNETSVVMALSAFGRPAALLTGDATTGVENALLEKKKILPTPILKVGHHGSTYSSSPEFLAAVRPAHAVISVGKNRYGHPSPAALLRLKAAGAVVWRTDRDGAVRATFTKP